MTDVSDVRISSPTISIFLHLPSLLLQKCVDCCGLSLMLLQNTLYNKTNKTLFASANFHHFLPNVRWILSAYILGTYSIFITQCSDCSNLYSFLNSMNIHNWMVSHAQIYVVNWFKLSTRTLYFFFANILKYQTKRRYLRCF